MAKFLDLIKANQVPSAVMRTASKGALPLPVDEMIEALVYLTQNPVFAQDAKMTLAGWDSGSLLQILSSPAAPAEVLGYFWSEQNRRPVLMPALIENLAIAEELLMELASAAPREILKVLMASPRARSSPAILEALSINPHLTLEELHELKSPAATNLATEVPANGPEQPAAAEADPETEAAHQAWREQHAGEIAAEEGTAFELTEDEEDQPTSSAEVSASAEEEAQSPEGAAPVEVAKSASSDALAAAALAMHAKTSTQDEKKLTLLQRLAKMSVAERVKTAFTGGREERAVLIRDPAKVVQNAVLSSPKLTDPEVESFAAAKNVHDNVLREINRNRRFIKNYAVQRNLVTNPKTPVEISLTLIRNLMVYDLKSLQRSRNVSETIRSVAQKLYREKSTSGGKLKS
jgi:hypothetical protein